jgi:hypothetical protein
MTYFGAIQKIHPLIEKIRVLYQTPPNFPQTVTVKIAPGCVYVPHGTSATDGRDKVWSDESEAPGRGQKRHRRD